eukprot:2298525-Rhodomonas_salina.3
MTLETSTHLHHLLAHFIRHDQFEEFDVCILRVPPAAFHQIVSPLGNDLAKVAEADPEMLENVVVQRWWRVAAPRCNLVFLVLRAPDRSDQLLRVFLRDVAIPVESTPQH